MRAIAHAYPDALPDPATARCYCFDEVFAEKIRALGERGRPRDLYDVVNLYRRQDKEASLNAGEIRDVLVDKCRTKGVPVPTLASVRTAARREEVRSEWENMHRHQLPELPPFEDFWTVLPELFEWLEGEPVAAELEVLRVAGPPIEESWAPPATVATWGWPVSLETVRFAAANRLCVELGYGGSRRIIEPYSLRRSRAGDTLLYAVRADSGEPRAYRVDRIESVRATQRTFTPRYRVELAASGGLRSPPVATRPRTALPPRSRRPARSGLVYIIECPYCRKRFRRTSMAKQKLNEHEAPGGFRCPGSGRRGHLVETRHP